MERTSLLVLVVLLLLLVLMLRLRLILQLRRLRPVGAMPTRRLMFVHRPAKHTAIASDVSARG